MESGFELCFPESEVYSARVNNLCVPSTVLSNFALKFNNEQMRRFRETCFGHLMELDKISFSGQMVHGMALRRVAGLGVKDIHGLSYAIGSNVVQFSAKVFCLISGLKFGVEPHITAEDEGVNRLLDAHITNKNHITLQDIEKAFLSAKFGSEDVFKLGMLCFIEFVILGKAPNVRINEEYLHLVHNMEELNNFPWGSISFEQLQDSLLFSPGKRESDENDDEKEKRQRKGKEEVKRKKKLEDKKRKRINRPAWTIKGLSFAFQVWAYELIPELEMAPLRYCKRKDKTELVPRICRWESTDKTPEFRKLNAYIFQSKQHVSLRPLRPSALELRQKYWTWGTNFHEEDAPSMGPRTYAAIDLQHMRLYGGKEARTHSNALVKMVNGKLPTWGKPWSSVKKVFMPYNVRQKHWVGLVLDLTSCEIFVYDSKIDLFRTHILVKAVQPLAKLITPLLEEAGYVGDFPLRKGEWPIHRVMDSAQQVGGGDCGMFVIKYCDFLSWNVDLGKISNEAMHLFRLKLTVDLLQGCYNI